MKYTIEDFFRNPEKTNFQISPSGEFITFLAPYQNRLNIFIQNVNDKTETRITGEIMKDILAYTWKKDRLIYLKDKNGDENHVLYSVDIESSDPLVLTDFPNVQTRIISLLPEDPQHLLISLNKRNAEIFDAYRINVETNELEMVAENPGNINTWIADHDGHIRMASTTDGVNTTLLYRNTEKDDFKPLFTTDFRESFSPVFFEFDNSASVYGMSNIGRDKAVFVKLNLDSLKEEVLFENDSYDISSASYSRKRKVITRLVWYSAKKQIHFFDQTFKDIYKDLEANHPHYEVSIVSIDDEEENLIYKVSSDQDRGTYYLYDVIKQKSELLAATAPWLNPEDMSNMQAISYKSSDGLTLEGYLSIPQGKEAKNLPLVVNPHGGPWARDYWGFNPEVQFLNDLGYAVFQVNFRGSTGFGKKFWEASFKQWGQKMQNDISEGVQYLISKGIADEKRIAIYGASYGGYATLAGLVYTPNLYCCGVDYVGVSNLLTFMQSIPPYWKPYLEMMYTMVGDPVKDEAMLKKYSPALNAEKIKVPLFIAQGANDPRVVKTESDQMVEAMRARGVEVEYMVKHNEGHGFRNEENRFDFYREMKRFLAEHL